MADLTFIATPDNMSDPARERLVHLRQQTGLHDAEILEALLVRSLDIDDGPLGLRRMFPNHFGPPVEWTATRPLMVGEVVVTPNPLTKWDLVRMFFGFARKSPETLGWRVEETHEASS
jgi:hypothetical protein